MQIPKQPTHEIISPATMPTPELAICLDSQLSRRVTHSAGVMWDISDPGNSDPNQRCVAQLHLLLGVEANGCCFGG